ncbi:MAG: tetratricopeptide repeat protein [Blastocatellia bacterium]|nr:tetratricopeptide repeat protein [Blastocatellia bacterium]
MRNYSNFNQSKLLSKFVVCLLFIAAFCANSFAQNEEWYLVFANGNAPKRAAFFVDMNSVKTPSAGVKSINFVYVLEEKGSPQYSTVDVEFRCNTDEVREVRASNYTFESTTVAVADEPWKKNVNPLLGEVKKLACNVDEFREARNKALENGRINSEKLNARLKEKGLNRIPMMPLVGVGFSDFDSILDFLWAKLWKTNRPQRTGIAKNTNKNGANNPTNATAKELVEIGVGRLKAGDSEDALKYFARAIQIDPNYSPAYFYRGYIYDVIGEFDLAISSYSTAISKNRMIRLRFSIAD